MKADDKKEIMARKMVRGSKNELGPHDSFSKKDVKKEKKEAKEKKTNSADN